MKVKVSRNVPRGQVFLLSTETLEGDKIGCIYSVMINLPDENSYKQVLIKLGRFPARPDLNEAILEPDDLDDLDE